VRLFFLRMINNTKKIFFTLSFGAISTAFAADMAPIAASATKIATPIQSPGNTKMTWLSLSLKQKTALSPLASEWDKLDDTRKKQWLEIANKYVAMKPDEQVRVQERMHSWMKLTPEQRMQARENFARTTQIKPEKKSAQWQEYQQLSDDQKKRLIGDAQQKRKITNVPPLSHSNIKPLAPIKTGPKPITQKPIEKPQAQANQNNAASTTSASQPLVR
jgi:hypothetical protein